MKNIPCSYILLGIHTVVTLVEQVGEQNLAFGLKFNAKGVVDCYEKELESLPSGMKRDIDFKMSEGDFQLFEGKWSILQVISTRFCNVYYTACTCIRNNFRVVYEVSNNIWLKLLATVKSALFHTWEASIHVLRILGS